MKEFVAARRRAAAAARQAKRIERRAAKLREREAAAARGEEGGDAGGEAGEAGAAAGDKSKKKKKVGAEEGGDSSGDDDAAQDLAYYEILEVDREAEAADIKRSYLRLATRCSKTGRLRMHKALLPHANDERSSGDGKTGRMNELMDESKRAYLRLAPLLLRMALLEHEYSL